MDEKLDGDRPISRKSDPFVLSFTPDQLTLLERGAKTKWHHHIVSKETAVSAVVTFIK